MERKFLRNNKPYPKSLDGGDQHLTEGGGPSLGAQERVRAYQDPTSLFGYRDVTISDSKVTSPVVSKTLWLRIEAPVRLSHAESWREGAVIHCKGYRLHPREPDAECTRAGGSTGTQQEKGRNGPLELCRTISGNVNGKKGNAPETHGIRNGTHGDVGKVDMCVLNPAPRNPGWKWGRGGCFIDDDDGGGVDSALTK
ncbi:hypothetical protein F2Q69_00012565 [Brassica cretica]|uniref:Uncharacterized protein n=1 Tax=Brassica cretica TaxID=69181 RepID=A0A8S9QZZ7_BRACR|nr:hypothetical protein F2Q69_00012565 [Brassica cretica]